MSGLVVVSGAPGTGKTTVAAALADGLGWPPTGTRSTATRSTRACSPGLGEYSATVTPLGLAPALVRVDTGRPGATRSALAAVRAALADRDT